VTITRVGTNEKYSTGWDGIFGGKASKKVAKAAPVAGKGKAVKKSVKVSSEKAPAAKAKAAPKKAAKKAAKKK